MPMYLIRGRAGGLALVSAASEAGAKLDLHCHCYGVEMDELTASELPFENATEGVVEIQAFTDGRPLL